MKCNKCGIKYSNSARFCARCGSELSVTVKKEKKKIREKRSLKEIFISFISFGILALVAMIVLSWIPFFMSMWKSKTIDIREYTEFELDNVKKVVTEYKYDMDEMIGCVSYFYGKKDICLAKITWADEELSYFTQLNINDEYGNTITKIDIDDDEIGVTISEYKYKDGNMTKSWTYGNKQIGDYAYGKYKYDKEGNIKKERFWYNDSVLPVYTFYKNKYDDDDLVEVAANGVFGKTYAMYEYAYRRGNMTYKKRELLGLDLCYEYYYEYDDEGLLSVETRGNPENAFSDRYEYMYNSNGDLREVFYVDDEEYYIDRYYEVEYVDSDLEIALEEADEVLSKNEGLYSMENPTSYYAVVEYD